MNRRTLMTAVIVVLTLAGCGGGSEPQQTADAGGPMPTGGGTGSIVGDAGTLDGGSRPDAGTPDAGAPDHITVSGSVINSYGQTVSSASVILLGVGSTTSDGSGKFTFQNVKVPYDLAVLSGVNSTATVYRGITRSNPRVRILDDTQTNPKATTKLTATMTGDVLPGSTTSTRYVASVFVPDGKDGQIDSVGNFLAISETVFSWDFSWWGASNETGTFHLLELAEDNTTKFNVDYRYGHAERINVAQGNSVQFGINMGVVDTQVLTVSAVLPTAATLVSLTVSLRFPNQEDLFLFSESSSTNVSLKVPRIPGASLGVKVRAKDNAGNVLYTEQFDLSTDQPASVVLPTVAPRLSLPVDKANGIDALAQVFSWVPVPSSMLSIVTFTAGALKISVVTTEQQVQLPDTTELGLGSIAPSTSVSWWVSAYGPEFTESRMLDPSGRFNELGDTWIGSSVTRTFTTK
jgi:hypothetical protein